MGLLSIFSGILALFQVATGHVAVSATAVYKTAVMVDKISSEELKGTWTAKIEDDFKNIIFNSDNDVKEKEND